MPKGKKNEPRKIDRWNPGDQTFLDNRTKYLSLSSPYELERSLKGLTESLKRSQTEPSLNPLLEFILREFEDEAKKKLEEKRLDPEYLTEVWCTLFDPKDSSCLQRVLEDDFPDLVSPLESFRQLQNAAHVSFCVDRVRKDISKGDSEQTAIDMLKLCFAAVNVNLNEMVTRGIRAKAAPARGGKVSNKALGILQAIKKILVNDQEKDALSLFTYFAKHHHGPEKAFLLENYKVFFMIDVKGIDEEKISFRDAGKRGKLFQIKVVNGKDDDRISQGVGLSSFRRYVKGAKEELKKDSQ